MRKHGMWKNQASFSEAWDVEKMKEQGSRNGVGRILRRIRGFGAHACRRHACGGQCPRRVPARGRNVRPARRIRCVFVHARPKPRTNPFSHSHTPGLESASGIYKTEKEKRAGSSLFAYVYRVLNVHRPSEHTPPQTISVYIVYLHWH